MKENEEVKVKKNIKKISAESLALCWENWGSDKKWFSFKKMCSCMLIVTEALVKIFFKYLAVSFVLTKRKYVGSTSSTSQLIWK